jgi:hypothetical protein
LPRRSCSICIILSPTNIAVAAFNDERRRTNNGNLVILHIIEREREIRFLCSLGSFITTQILYIMFSTAAASRKSTAAVFRRMHQATSLAVATRTSNNSSSLLARCFSSTGGGGGEPYDVVVIGMLIFFLLFLVFDPEHLKQGSLYVELVY